MGIKPVSSFPSNVHSMSTNPFRPIIIVIIFCFDRFTLHLYSSIFVENIESDENRNLIFIERERNFWQTTNMNNKISTILFLRSSLFFFPFNTSPRRIPNIYRDNLASMDILYLFQANLVQGKFRVYLYDYRVCGWKKIFFFFPISWIALYVNERW